MIELSVARALSGRTYSFSIVRLMARGLAQANSLLDMAHGFGYRWNRPIRDEGFNSIGGFMAQAATVVAEEKKVKFCDKSYDDASEPGGKCYFKFGNGTELVLDTDSLSAEIQKQLRLHGAIQKVGDSFSGAKGNYVEGIANAQGVIDALTSGNWGVQSDARPRLAELAAAIARLKGVPIEKATTAVEGATEEQRAAWRSNAAVKHAIQELRLEAAQRALAEATKAGAQELVVNFDQAAA